MPVNRPPQPGRRLAVAGLLFTVLIWGSTFVAIKAALREVPPLTLSFLRFLLASVALVPLAWARRRGPGQRGDGKVRWVALLVAGLVGGCLYSVLQNIGLVYTSASKASLILAAIPALTAMLSVPFLHERVGRARAAGVVASVAGVALIVAADPAATWQGSRLAGDLLIVGAAVAWAAYTVLSKGLERQVSPAVLSAATVGFGALFMLPLAAYEALQRPPALPTAQGWLAIAYLGLIACTVPFLLWNWALKCLDASEAAVYTNLVPLVAVVSAVLLLGETVTPAQLAGGGLVLVGVWAASKKAPEGAGELGN